MNIGIILGTSIIIINILSMLVLIFFERKNPTTTWAWLLVIMFLPVIGFIVYLLFGQSLTKEKMFSNKILTDQKKKEYFNKVKNQYKYKNEVLENIDIIQMNFRNTNAIYTQKNSVELFFEGKSKFSRLFKEIKDAKNFIHMEYYIIQNDSIGNDLIELLTEKVKEGVEVKLLFDAMGSYKINNKKFLRKFTEAGGRYAAFFPSIIPHINLRINYRNHRKIVVVDGNKGFIGGFNVGDEYLGKDNKIGNWRDTHIIVEGEAVKELEERFLLDWAYASGEELGNYNKYFEINYLPSSSTGMQIVSSGPDHEEPYIRNVYLKILNKAMDYVYIQSPYFVPDETMLSALKLSSLSGVDVRIMIPGRPDHKFMSWAANSYIGELLEVGVKIYLYNNGFIHCKTVVSDNSVCTIGTANMDIRSFDLNFETNAVIYDREISENLSKQFIEDMSYCKQVTLENFINRGRGSKIAESIVRLLSPIL
ncbi:cardiolipin synthase [Hathewaya histolytica]|uniref:Cardiolipin synthase n=1 Tax=Hathewaya histolytica TaxID=1498 RepID=A0A4U9RNM3_HATHI|nr:cardiolipin synthase [Hathewaya histolytica]VTQ93158.1 phospholipase D/transphosphatidylase [Hathewaya histolytica]